MWKLICVTLVVIAIALEPTNGYYTYQSRLPNGAKVQHPCKPNYLWAGVGHYSPAGGGKRNPFGEDFASEGHMWTEALCRMDSDNDGRTNGQELGDPNCTWKQGEIPDKVDDITHPGICTPYGEGVCAGKDEFVDCELEEFGDTCDVIKKPEVMTMDLRFKEVKIPASETNYYCQYFDLPQDNDYHIVADEGIIDNQNVVHHMILYACPDDFKGFEGMENPGPCSMGGENNCYTIVSLWALGGTGSCFGEEMGFKIGMTGYKKIKLEIHYNNPKEVEGYTDTSGIRVYYRPLQQGVVDLATFTVGQQFLDIPPGEDSVEVEGVCSGSCTNRIITKPMYVVSTQSHMHYLGRAQKTEVIRDGRVVKVLADDTPYSYDSPIAHKHEPAFEVLPGDELKTTCTFSSMSSQKYVTYGDGTQDEMCYAFLTVYPADAPRSKWCVAHGPLDTCEFYSGKSKYGCDWARFVNVSMPEMWQLYSKMNENCRLDGHCRPQCKGIVDAILENPCMHDPMNKIVSHYLSTYHEGTKMLGWVRACQNSDGDDDHDSSEMDCKKECSHMMCDREEGDNYKPVEGHDSHAADGDGDWASMASGNKIAVPALLVMTSFFAMVTAMFF